MSIYAICAIPEELFCHFWSIVAAAVLQNNYSSAQLSTFLLPWNILKLLFWGFKSNSVACSTPISSLTQYARNELFLGQSSQVDSLVIIMQGSSWKYIWIYALLLNKVLECEGENWYKLEWFYNAHKGNASSHFTILWSTFYWL